MYLLNPKNLKAEGICIDPLKEAFLSVLKKIRIVI